MAARKSRPDGASASRVRGGFFFLVAVLAAGCAGRASRDGVQGSGSGGSISSAGAAGATSAAGGSSAAGYGADGGSTASETCAPGSAPLRRLTRAEYIASASALFGDVTATTAHLPEEPRSFPIGNWAERQRVGLEQATAYSEVAKQLAAHATRDPQALAELSACAAQATPDPSCARTTIESFASKAFRRAPTEQELSELLALHSALSGNGANFARATEAVITAILQGPEFLYRIEWGTGSGPRPDVQRLTGDEMASRLSYLFWGSSPDEHLRESAQSGALLEPDGIAREAARLLDDPRSHAGLSTFFDDFLDLYRLPELQQADPSYSPELGRWLQRATQRFLEAQIFEQQASWPEVLTAHKAFVNGPVAGLFGVSGITGDELREVALDPTQRLGLLTQPGVLVARSDSQAPIQRGFHVMERVLCRHVPEPPEIPPKISEPPAEPATTRQRWTHLTEHPSCGPCHGDMNQLGFAFENFDSLGRFRSQEHGLDIDAKVDVTGLGPTNGPIELVQKLASLPEAQACFARRFAEFGLGKSLASDPADACLTKDIAQRFQAAGFDVRKLLISLTQTDAFLYLPKDH